MKPPAREKPPAPGAGLGLYPLCIDCGARVEMERLRADPMERYCWSCGQRHRPAGRNR